jgi:hypothetical protein
MLSLDASGNLVLATVQPGLFVAASGTIKTEDSLIRPMAKSSADNLVCSIKTNVVAYPGQPVLQCSVPGYPGFFNSFEVQADEGYTYLMGSPRTTTWDSNLYLVDLGVFTGAQCF